MKPTREQILSEPAGRTLDIWVALYVMADWQDDGWWHSKDGSKTSRADGGPRPYSTEIKDAWEVVEVMRRRGCLPTLLERANGEWRAQLLFTDGEGFRHWPGAAADSPALAVCRAALLACVDAQVQP
jgi:hypothetical protein